MGKVDFVFAQGISSGGFFVAVGWLALGLYGSIVLDSR